MLDNVLDNHRKGKKKMKPRGRQQQSSCERCSQTLAIIKNLKEEKKKGE